MTQTKDFKYPIAYLERNDFSDSGELLNQFNKKPVFIMIQASYCPACTTSKPEFQKLANEGIITCLTIQIDGERETEKEITKIIKKIYPDIAGIPAYLLIVENKKLPYTEDRTMEGMKQFILTHLNQS